MQRKNNKRKHDDQIHQYNNYQQDDGYYHNESSSNSKRHKSNNPSKLKTQTPSQQTEDSQKLSEFRKKMKAALEKNDTTTLAELLNQLSTSTDKAYLTSDTLPPDSWLRVAVELQSKPYNCIDMLSRNKLFNNGLSPIQAVNQVTYKSSIFCDYVNWLTQQLGKQNEINLSPKNKNPLLHFLILELNSPRSPLPRADISFRIKALLNANADLELKNNLGQTPLDMAIKLKEWNIADLIREKQRKNTLERTNSIVSQIPNNAEKSNSEKTDPEKITTSSTSQTTSFQTTNNADKAKEIAPVSNTENLTTVNQSAAIVPPAVSSVVNPLVSNISSLNAFNNTFALFSDLILIHTKVELLHSEFQKLKTQINAMPPVARATHSTDPRFNTNTSTHTLTSTSNVNQNPETIANSSTTNISASLNLNDNTNTSSVNTSKPISSSNKKQVEKTQIGNAKNKKNEIDKDIKAYIKEKLKKIGVAMEGHNNSRKNDIENLAVTVDAIQITKDLLEKRVETLKTTITEAAKKHTSLSSLVNENKINKNQLQEVSDKVEKILATTKENLEEVTDSLTITTDKLKEAQEQLEKQSQQLQTQEEKTKQLEETTNPLQTQIKDQQDKIDSQEIQLQSQQKTIDSQHAKIESQQQQIDELQQQFATMQSKVEEQAKSSHQKIQSMQQQLLTMQNEAQIQARTNTQQMMQRFSTMFQLGAEEINQSTRSEAVSQTTQITFNGASSNPLPPVTSNTSTLFDKSASSITQPSTRKENSKPTALSPSYSSSEQK